MTRSRTRASAVVAGAAAVLLLAACGDGADLPGYGAGGATASATQGTEGTADAGATGDADADSPTTDVPFPADARADTAEPSAGAALVVTDVRVAAHDGFDRVVFDLDGDGTPGWDVEYVDGAADDGSGEPVEVDGDAILQVRLSGMAMPTEGDLTEYDGTTLDPQDTETVDEVVYRFWFEGYTTAFVGVDDEAGEPLPFRVFALADPARVVVDVQHDPDDDPDD